MGKKKKRARARRLAEESNSSPIPTDDQEHGGSFRSLPVQGTSDSTAMEGPTVDDKKMQMEKGTVQSDEEDLYGAPDVTNRMGPTKTPTVVDVSPGLVGGAIVNGDEDEEDLYGAPDDVTTAKRKTATRTALAENATPVNAAFGQTTSAVNNTAHSKPSRFKIKPFRRMIRQLETYLGPDDVIEIAGMTDQEPDFLIKISDMGKPFHYLMANLEKQGIVGENNVDALIELLEEIDAEEAIEVVHEYKMSLIDCNTEGTPDPEKASALTRDKQPSVTVLHDSDRPHKSPPKSEKPPPTQLRQQLPSAAKNQRSKSVTSTWEDIIPTLEALSIRLNDERKLTIIDSMTLDTIHVCESNLSQNNVVMAFLTHLMSYDYRSLRLFKEISMDNDGFQPGSRRTPHQVNVQHKVSCRDIIYAIIRSCDPFLRQDVLSKMSSCQLAVPILLPETNHTGVTFLLWGLQKISKAWQDPRTSVIHEESVSNYPFPVVSAIKFGNPDCSKSNILNKVLGSVQGNDDHPYFVSCEQESNNSVLSYGTLEAVWYLPTGAKRSRHSLNEAMCFLNLRGDAGGLHRQLQFLFSYTMVIVLFISKRDIRRMWNQVSELAKRTKLIIVMCSSGKLGPKWKEDDKTSNSVRMLGANTIDTHGQSTIDICEDLCMQIEVMLSQKRKNPGSLSDMTSLCEEKEISVDMSAQECSGARESAETIIQQCRANPEDYKRRALPLQLKWQRWSELDKDRSWKGAQGNVERELARLHRAKAEQRRQQREIGMSKEMKMLYERLCHPSPAYRQYLVFWLHHYLNEVSFGHLRPLADDLKASRDRLRESGAKITSLQRKVCGPAVPRSEKHSIEKKIVELKTEESELQRTLAEKTKMFDASSLGFEHFIREFGQIYECFHNNQVQQQIQRFDTNHLPRMAAEMLLSGYPLEIFDGDTCHVPIKWVKGVFAAVRRIIGDASIYVISVIGIQSSGKSTLLNSMFGVHFAVSAGRCTRGVFLQLLPIAEELKQELDCDYVAVIDTEGLKAPEKAVAERKSEDNELATFALCLSDMTLINIGGQTVGEDLSNILQISAHAFIRMKEVHLRSSCYLIQQFVADITAQYRNQTSTQSILQKLDQAVLTAAVEEKKEDQYRQFSDCFNIVNIDNEKENVQYIPSLWRGPMSSPNHDYSETVSKLKSALLREIRQAERLHKISEFEERIASVWEAVKQEDFVFNFRNTNEIAQYSNFSQMFKRQQLHLTQEMMKWELNAKQMIKSTSVDNVQGRQEALFKELEEKLTSEVDKIRVAVDETLQRKEYDSVRQHSVYFFRDLDLVEANTRDTIKNMIRMETSIITNAETKETQLLPQLRANLRRHVLPVAEQLKKTLPQDFSDNASENIAVQNEDVVRMRFEQEWEKEMNTVQLDHPMSTQLQIQQNIEKDVIRCVMETLRNTSLSKEMKELMHTRNIFELCKYSPTVSSPDDIAEACTLTASCTPEITQFINTFCDIVDNALRRPEFRFSTQFVNELSGSLAAIVSAQCAGCQDKRTLLLCLSCYAIQKAHTTHKENLLEMIIRSQDLLQTLKRNDVSTVSQIKKDVKECLKDSTMTSASNDMLTMLKNFAEDRVLAMFMNTTGNSDENFQNQIRRRLSEIIARRNTKKWYSSQVTKDFINMAQEVIAKKRNSDFQRKRHFLGLACKLYIQEAIQSEKEALAQSLSWESVQQIMKTDPVSIADQMKRFTEVLHDVLPPVVTAALLKLPEESIVKYSQISVHVDIRHALDECFLSELGVLAPDHSHGLLSVVQDTRQLFLCHIQESGSYTTNLFRAVLTTLHDDLRRRRELGDTEHVVSMAHICSWALPICVGLQVTFERENSVQSLLRKEKALLYEDFKSLIDGRCLDHLAAKSFCAILDETLKANVKNRICTALFDRLSKSEDEIFCSRPRFLKAVLMNICEEEKFENYTGFLCNHSSFIQKWALNFIARECCETENNHIRLEDIVLHEVDEIIRETEESLEAALRAVLETDENVPFEVWVQNFSEYFENQINASLNEESVSEMSMYAVVSDYSMFIEECKVLLSDSVLQNVIDSVELPDMTSRISITNWIESLPKKLHVVLAKSVQGCGTQCPFCKTLCDDTIKEHKVHFSNLHYPIGVGGWRDRRSQILVSDTCTANVASDRRYYSCHCSGVSCIHGTKPYRDYKLDYPNWDIRPIAEYEATLYWKWVLSRFNADFARYYNCKQASIPWGTVTKQEALSSIQNMV